MSSASKLPAGVTDPIPRALLRLALPVLASHALRVAYQWVDALWVRGLGVNATAAVTTSVFVMWWMYALNDVVAIGVMAYVSQLLGAGERGRAGVAAWKGLRASAALGVLASVFGAFGAAWAAGLMGETGETARVGTAYLRVVLMGAPLPMLCLTCESIMRSSGDTRTPLLLDLGSVAFNAVLAPLLIYGLGSFRGLGVVGAGLATLCAQALLLLGYAWLALRRHPAFPLSRRAAGPPVNLAGMARVGMPAALIGMLFSVVYINFARAASVFGPAALAVVGIVNRVESLEYMVAVAIGGAGAALVGQNLGAGRVDRATRVISTGLRWGLVFSGILMIPLLGFPGFFVSLFSTDPEVLRLGTPYMRIVGACALFNTAELITAEGVIGSGHTAPISIIFSVFSLIRIPLTLMVPGWGFGVLGIAWVISSTCVLRAITILAWASRGTWKKGLSSQLQVVPGSRPEPPEGL